jgi:uncharacterized protein YjbI with pentapeptide repeats
VLHLPSEDKKADFRKAIGAKLRSKDFDFGGAFFPSGTAQFKDCKFVRVNFSGATFCGKTDFSEAQFSGQWTDFSGAKFISKEISFEEAFLLGTYTFRASSRSRPSISRTAVRSRS